LAYRAPLVECCGWGRRRSWDWYRLDVDVQGYYPTEYNMDCFGAYRATLDSCSEQLKCELDQLNDMDLVNCDKVLKDKRRLLIRRVQVAPATAACRLAVHFVMLLTFILYYY